VEINREQLELFIAYADQREIHIPIDVQRAINRLDTQDIINSIIQVPELWDAARISGLIPYQNLPLFSLKSPGIVPAPNRTGLVLYSTGWNTPISPQITNITNSGGRRSGGGGVTAHNFLSALDYATAGHTGFSPDTHTHALLHNAVTIDANADTLLELAGQILGLDTQIANRVFSGPIAGIDAIPSFRALVAADIPVLNYQAPLTFPLAPNLGGTGIANLAASTLTLGAATSITGGGTLALGGFVATVPATGTLALRSDKLSAFAATTSAELAGVLSDESGSGLAVFNTRPTLTNDAQTCQLLTDAASVAWDTDLGTVAYVKVVGNRTIANPTNFRAGGQYTLYIQQDLTGGRVITWGTAFLWDNNKVPVINTTPFAMSVFGFFSDGTYLFGTSNTPTRKGLADSVVYLGDVVTHSGEILWN
jgi:hypothetical protein